MKAMKIWQVYWRHKKTREVNHGYVKAENENQAYNITMGKLQRGWTVTAVYPATENMITPQSLTLNFINTTDYTLF